MCNDLQNPASSLHPVLRNKTLPCTWFGGGGGWWFWLNVQNHFMPTLVHSKFNWSSPSAAATFLRCPPSPPSFPLLLHFPLSHNLSQTALSVLKYLFKHSHHLPSKVQSEIKVVLSRTCLYANRKKRNRQKHKQQFSTKSFLAGQNAKWKTNLFKWLHQNSTNSSFGLEKDKNS